eukprot:scaffold1911_cov397-Prasinococcus_capsulatus_cf.AAC.9
MPSPLAEKAAVARAVHDDALWALAVTTDLPREGQCWPPVALRRVVHKYGERGPHVRVRNRIPTL